MHALRTALASVAMALAAPMLCQVTFPDCYIQNWNWTSGAHHYTVPQPLYSPGDPNAPVSSTGTANTEFVSATQVRLTPGFHAGDLSGEGRFRAHINTAVGDPDDLVVITPDASQISDGVLHVNKWEKLELGYRLPQTYRDAIASFFENYYPYTDDPNDPDDNSDPWISAPSNTDALHDLNPYADDSLQLVMTLTSPSGIQRMKWGFYMTEAMWQAQTPSARLRAAYTSSPLFPFNVRFRFAPDEEGLWQFSLSIKAPYTTTAGNAPLPQILYSGYSFVCNPPLPDNLGPLSVNPNNERTLWFDGDGQPNSGDETSFFGLGVNMADVRNGTWDPPDGNGPANMWYTLHYRDYEDMTHTMEQLHAVGGNFMRMFLMRNIFAPEWVNLGVYDAFKTPEVCDLSFPPNCGGGWTGGYAGNCQYQCWAFDKMLDLARANGIYIQLCIDPYPPIIGFERYIWGAHPYMIHFLEPNRNTTGNGNPLDLKRFFYSYADPSNTQSAKLHEDGAFYYWKRKYKYMMSRWGYSVNLPIIEPFNEVDQMLSYRKRYMLTDDNENTGQPCNNHGSLCRENVADWDFDPLLPVTYDSWLTDLIGFVKDPVITSDPTHSPLGEKHKMFLTGVGHDGTGHPDYFLPCKNPKLSLVDVHTDNKEIGDVRRNRDMAQTFRNDYSNLATGEKRPFRHGEYSTYGPKDLVFIENGQPVTREKTTYPYFRNYDVSFHNELWASTFYGNFTAGTTWAWERVFWWRDGMEPPLDDVANTYQTAFPPDNRINEPNMMLIPGFGPLEVENKPVHHHFKRLSGLLNHQNWAGYNFFSGDFSVHRHTYNPSDQNDLNTDEGRRIECYWLLREPGKDLAIGWVHNMNAYWDNSWYMRNGNQNMLACTSPGSQTITLGGFADGNTYHVTYYPTRMNTTVAPDDQEDDDLGTTITLDLGSEPLSGAVGSLLDTLHSDYAFVIATDPFVKSLRPPAMLDPVEVTVGWDFALYPNPARDELIVQLPDEFQKDIVLHDLTGRQVMAWRNVRGPLHTLQVGAMAKGIYWISVSDAEVRRTKKLILN